MEESTTRFVYEGRRVEVLRFDSVVYQSLVGRPGDIICVVVGESGVGKSTFITHLGNAFCGSSSTDFNHFLSIDRSVMKSDTMESYLIILSYGNKRFIIMDTPGLNDTHGRAKDIQHINNILQGILRLHHINAVFFLAKGHDSRFSESMQYTIDTILGFCPTTFKDKVGLVLTGTPGDFNFDYTKTPLAKWNPVQFVTDNPFKPFYNNGHDGQNYALRSWERSKEVALAILAWSERQPPATVEAFKDIRAKRDKIASTIDNALATATSLNQVLSEIEISKKRKENAALEEGKLAPRLKHKVPKTIYVNEPSSYYSTWCRQHPVNQSNVRSACHENCRLPYNSEGGNDFRHCAAMDSVRENCSVCGCGWQSHYHSNARFVERTVEEEEIDIVVQNELNRLKSLLDEEEAKVSAGQDRVGKLKTAIELNMREVVETAQALVHLCNGFNLAEDLSNQIVGLDKRIAITVDHNLKQLFTETREALVVLQDLASKTAVEAGAKKIEEGAPSVGRRKLF